MSSRVHAPCSGGWRTPQFPQATRPRRPTTNARKSPSATARQARPGPATHLEQRAPRAGRVRRRPHARLRRHRRTSGPHHASASVMSRAAATTVEGPLGGRAPRSTHPHARYRAGRGAFARGCRRRRAHTTNVFAINTPLDVIDLTVEAGSTPRPRWADPEPRKALRPSGASPRRSAGVRSTSRVPSAPRGDVLSAHAPTNG